MSFIIAGDIHGMLDIGKFVLLGDVADRGPEPIRILQDMMNCSNVIFVLGNWHVSVLKQVDVFILVDNTPKKTQILSLHYAIIYKEKRRRTQMRCNQARNFCGNLAFGQANFHNTVESSSKEVIVV